MPLTYDRNGIRFLYPDDWTIVDEVESRGLRSVSIEAQSGAQWSVSKEASARSPADLLNEALRAMREVYPDVEVTSFDATVADWPATGYEMEFFYLDLIITARATAWRQGAESVLILAQAENREFARKQRVFDALLASLVGTADVSSGD